MSLRSAMLELLGYLQGRHIAARPLSVGGANVGWDTTPQKFFLRVHISPGSHYLSALNIFPAIFNLVYFHRTIGGVAVGKADKLVVPVSIIAYSLPYRCEVRKPTEPRQHIRTNFNMYLV